jgi:hypothetical protein
VPPPASALVEPAPAPAPAAGATASRWYGYQILIADGASLGLLTLGVLSSGTGLAVLGAAGYVAGGPIVHGLNGQGGRAAGSVALRLLGPVAGFGAGSAHKEGSDGWSSSMYSGLLAGFLVPMVLDWAVLGWVLGDLPPSPSAPRLEVDPSAGGFSLVGHF